MWGSIPGPWDHDLGQSLKFNPLSHPGTPLVNFFYLLFSASVLHLLGARESALCEWRSLALDPP